MLLLLATLARAEEACATFYTPADVVEAAMRMQGARLANLDVEAERRLLLVRLSCTKDPLAPEDAAAVHLALGGERLVARPPPTPRDAAGEPPHPEDGVALVDGVAHAALPPGEPAVVQAFDAEGHVVYTRWLDAGGVEKVRAGGKLPTSPTVPKFPPAPLRDGEVGRLVAGGALMVASGALFAVAATARADWYALDPSPVDTVEELERLRVKTNVTQGLGLACAGIGAAGLLSVAVRVPF